MKGTLYVMLVVAGLMMLHSCSSGGKISVNKKPGIITDDTYRGGGMDQSGPDLQAEVLDLVFPGDTGEWIPFPFDGSGETIYNPCGPPPVPFGCPCEGNVDCESG